MEFTKATFDLAVRFDYVPNISRSCKADTQKAIVKQNNTNFESKVKK